MTALLSIGRDQKEKSEITYFSYFPAIVSNDYVELLPSDHALYYPLRFKNDKSTFSGTLNFYNKVFFENFSNDNFIDENRYTIENLAAKKQKVLFVNLIDNCFGHSFQKLLNLINIDASHGAEFDICVIVQKSISHFVPLKFIKIEVTLGYAEAQKCYDLKPALDKVKRLYDVYDFAALDTYAILPEKAQLRDFFPLLEYGIYKKKCIVFYYRKDLFRSWTPNAQSSHIDEFFEKVATLFSPDIEFIVVGDKDEKEFRNPRIIDRRVSSFSAKVDWEYNSYFASSVLTIGLIGSNMLLPSLLSSRTIHLVPSTKVTIIAEEIINSVNCAITNSLENIYLVSATASLSDYTPKRLAYEVKMLFLTALAKEYKHSAFKLLQENKKMSQQDYITMFHPYFKYDVALLYKKEEEIKQYKWLWKYFHFSRILRKLKFK